MHSFYSPLRYPGGKGKIADYFKNIFKINSLYDGVYIEPYAGGASVALSLLFNQYASHIIINDIDRSIYAFWYSVLHKTEKLCKLIWDTPLNIETWLAQKTIQKSNNKHSLLKAGFAAFYLNRTNRSGILNAGVIGGKEQNGRWKLNARFNKEDLVQRIERIALSKNKIELHNVDAMELLKNIKGLPPKTLLYFDPPYYTKGKELYLNYYKQADHIEIASRITNLNAYHWIVTYDDQGAINKLYSGFRRLHYSLNYSAFQNNKGREIMIFSDGLKIAKNLSSRK